MAKFPILTEMGVNKPEEISRYTLHQIGDVDHLRIIYKRKKNSLLPVSKRFKFGRSQKMVVVDSGTRKTETVHEISPFLLKAVAELDLIVKRKRSKKDLVRDLEEEIIRIEEDMGSHMASLRALIDKLD